MKKLIKAIVLLFVFMMLTGCVTSTTKVSISKNKNVAISVYILTDDSKNIDVSKEIDVVSLANRGFVIDKVSQDGYSGLKITKQYKNIDDLSSLEDVKITITDVLKDGFDDSKYFKVQKSFFVNTYTADFKYKLASEIFNYVNKHEDIDTSKLHTYLDETKFKFVAELPYGQIQSNAGSVEGNTLTWNLNSSEDNNISFAFDVYNLVHIGIVAGTALIVFITVLVVVLVKTKAKRQEKRRAEKERKAQEAALKQQQEEEWKKLNNVPEIATVDSTNMTANKSFEFALEYNDESKKNVIKNRKFVEVSTREEVLDFDKNKPQENINAPVVEQPQQVQQPEPQVQPVVNEPMVQTPQSVEPTIEQPAEVTNNQVDNVPTSKFISNEPTPEIANNDAPGVPTSKFVMNEPTPEIVHEPQLVIQEPETQMIPEKMFMDDLNPTSVGPVGAPKNDSPFDNEENLDEFLPNVAVNTPSVDPTLAEFGLGSSAPAQAPKSAPMVDPTLAEFGDLFGGAPQQNQAPNNNNKFV